MDSPTGPDRKEQELAEFKAEIVKLLEKEPDPKKWIEIDIAQMFIRLDERCGGDMTRHHTGSIYTGWLGNIPTTELDLKNTSYLNNARKLLHMLDDIEWYKTTRIPEIFEMHLEENMDEVIYDTHPRMVGILWEIIQERMEKIGPLPPDSKMRLDAMATRQSDPNYWKKSPRIYAYEDCRNCGKHVPLMRVGVKEEPKDGLKILLKCPRCGDTSRSVEHGNNNLQSLKSSHWQPIDPA